MSSSWVALEGAEGMLPHPPEARPVGWPNRHSQFKHSPPCCDPGRKRHAQGGRERGVLSRGEQLGSQPQRPPAIVSMRTHLGARK